MSISRFISNACVGAAASLLFLIPAEAQADAGCEASLAKVDAALNAYKTIELHYTMLTQEPGKRATRMKIRTRIKARKTKKKQFTELLAPADMKGTKVLSLSASKMWIYLPSFRKVRRVASHTSDQSFLGTAFSAADMNLSRYSKIYSCSQQGDTLDLKARDGKGATYGRIVIKIDKAKMLPLDMKYFDAGGRHVKTELRSGYFCEGKVCSAKTIKMTNHAKGGLWSELTLTDHKINAKMSKKLFSKRNLR
jgi:outer membrane lipoprotein-sorting protein